MRLIVPKGAKIDDSNSLFNAGLEVKAICDIEFHKIDELEEAVLKELVRALVDISRN